MEHILTHVELVSSSNSFAPKPDHNMLYDSYDTLWTKCKVFPVPLLKKSYALVLVNINSTYALPQNSPSVTQTQTIQTIHSFDLTKIERGRDRDNN